MSLRERIQGLKERWQARRNSRAPLSVEDKENLVFFINALGEALRDGHLSIEELAILAGLWEAFKEGRNNQ